MTAISQPVFTSQGSWAAILYNRQYRSALWYKVIFTVFLSNVSSLFPAQTIPVVLYWHRVSSGAYVCPLNKALCERKQCSSGNAAFSPKRKLVITCFECVVSLHSAGTRWVSGWRRWPDPAYGNDGVGGGGTGPVSAAPIQPQRSPFHRQTLRTSQRQYWSDPPCVTKRSQLLEFLYKCWHINLVIWEGRWQKSFPNFCHLTTRNFNFFISIVCIRPTQIAALGGRKVMHCLKKLLAVTSLKPRQAYLF